MILLQLQEFHQDLENIFHLRTVCLKQFPMITLQFG